MSWTADPLAARRAKREELIARARAYVELLGRRLPIVGAAVAGSVARGDFNVWSDVDVVVVVDALPESLVERSSLLGADAPAGLELHGYTPAELRRALERGDRLAREAVANGVPLSGTLPGAER